MKIDSADKNWINGNFSWQEGYGYFSHSHSELDKVIKYIRNQKEHHAKTSFKEEYLEILRSVMWILRKNTFLNGLWMKIRVEFFT